MANTLLHIFSACVAGVAAGFLLRDSIQNSSNKKSLRHRKPKATDDQADLQSEPEFESESDSDDDFELPNINNEPGEVRMTLIVRQDLKMGKGKAAAQCSHATLALYKRMSNPQSRAYNPEMLKRWEYGNGQAKITLQVPTQEEMDVLFATAMSLGVNAYVVHDAGRTQIAAGSATVLGLGPAPKSVMDQITSNLKLY